MTTTYKNLEELDSRPLGLGGALIHDNFRILDEISHLYKSASDPTANDDAVNTSGNGIFREGSRWYNTSSGEVFVCTSDASGTAVWQSLALYDEMPFKTDSGLISQIHNYTDDFVIGSPQLADDGNSDHDSRVWFDKSRAAFRAGMATGDEWDITNVGNYSAAFGLNNVASGEYSAVFGRSGEASGYAATHFGRSGEASGYAATHFGGGTASGDYSTHFGTEGTASGYFATHFGYSGTASGYAATHFGGGGTASGDYSTHFGGSGEASGDYSTHLGRYGVASLYAQTVFASGRNGAYGDAQVSLIPHHDEIDHSDTAWHTIYIDGTDDVRTVQTDSSNCVICMISGTTQGAAKSFAWIIYAHVENDGGTVTIKSQTKLLDSDADDTSFDAQLAVSGTAVVPQVKDADGTGDTVRWSAAFFDTEAAYAA
jgi:hypothetical protein